VLDVVEQEHILQNVHDVSAYLVGKLRELASRFPLIGDVRGKGFFLGLELVKDHKSLEPAPEEAGRVRDAMRDQGVLVATSGPLDNLIKIRPPLVFSRDNADLLLENLELAFSSM